MKTYIKGHYKKAIFKSEAGYVIGLFKVLETNIDDDIYTNKTITFTGYFPELNEIDTYIFYGNIVVHERYGEQFSVSSFEKVLPSDKDGIVSFLSSGLFKGIGEAKAKKIVKVLGSNTLKTILEQKDNLLLIPTITKKNVDTLYEGLLEYQNSYQIIVKLSEMGFFIKDSIAIYNHYKEKTLDIIDEDIYQIMGEVDNIGFRKIDQIAIKKNIDKYDKRRVKAAIIYIVGEVCNTVGHSYLLKNHIFLYLYRVIGRLDNTIMETSLGECVEEGKIIQEEDRYYLKEMYDAEVYIGKRIRSLSMRKNEEENYDRKIKEIEELYQIKYNDKQKEAISSALSKNILVITGGPGTGKTTIINAICDIYKLKHKLSQDKFCEEVALLAPTGRAAKRMALSSKRSASTIHRFLKWNKDTNKFQVNEHNKSKAKVIILDEASMLDTYLFYDLLKGLYQDTKIILVGDVDQLPSVGPGEVLKDIIDSKKIDTIFLKYLYRQKENSNITLLAHQIKEDNIDFSVFNNKDDLTFIECSSDMVKSYIKEVIEAYPLSKRKDIQVLSPMYKTKNGIDELNTFLQEVLNKKKDQEQLKVGDTIFRESDKVLGLTNMPDDNVYNGDIGTIIKINNNKNKQEIIVDYDDSVVRYTKSNFSSITLGYTISIHKSQGSEFDYLILPIVNNYNKMLYKKLIYTAVTRCKKNLYLIGSKEAFVKAVKNDALLDRMTTLKQRI